MSNRRAMLKNVVLAAVFAPAAMATSQVAAQSAGTPNERSVARAWQDSRVPVNGTIAGPNGATFSGTAEVRTRYVPDPDFGVPSIIFWIDMSGVQGTGHGAAKQAYQISGPEVVQKRAASSYTLEVAFSYFPVGSSGTTDAKAGLATFKVVTDANGALTSGHGQINPIPF